MEMRMLDQRLSQVCKTAKKPIAAPKCVRVGGNGAECLAVARNRMA